MRSLFRNAILVALAVNRFIRLRMRAFVYRDTLLKCGSCFAPGPGLELRAAANIAIGSTFRTGRNVRIHAWPSYAGQILAQSGEALIEIGDNVFINDNSYITGAFGIRIGDNCLIGSNVLIADNSHGEIAFTTSPRACEPLSSRGQIHIGENVWICNNVVLTAGVTIGANSIIAANSVVTSNVGDGALVGGVPAKLIRLLHVRP
jgi:acetyltransferase-like isoleucine patch superfamily enzyme